MSELYNYIIQFLIGGFIISGTGYLAKNLSTKTLAIFWALPITLTFVILFFFYKKKNPIQRIRYLLLENIPSVIILLLWIITLYFLLLYLKFWPSILLSFVFFGIFSVIYWFLPLFPKNIN